MNRKTTGTLESLIPARSAIRPSSTSRSGIQPPDAENRTFGGVGALTGAIPSGPPDSWRCRRAVTRSKWRVPMAPPAWRSSRSTKLG